MSTVTRTRDWARYAAAGFAVSYVASIVLTAGGADVYTSSPEEFAAHYGDAENHNLLVLGAYLLFPLAAVFLAWTVARIRTALTPVAAGAATVGAAVLATVSVVSGILTYTGALVSASAEDGFAADPSAGHALMLAAANLAVAQGVGAAVVAWSVAIGARRSGRLPGWLVWTGIVLTPLLPYAWIFAMIPMLAFLIWLVAVSIIVKTQPADA